MRPPAPLVALALCWLAGMLVLAFAPGANLQLPLASAVLFGVVFTAVLVWLTPGSRPPPVFVRAPMRSMLMIALYLALFAMVVLGWGLGAIRDLPIGERGHAVAAATVKVVTMALAPLLLIRLGGDDIRALLGDGQRRFRTLVIAAVFVALSVAVTAVATPSLASLGSMAPSATDLAWAIPLTALWVLVTAGLTEEVLFRVVLQSRLRAVLHSDISAVAAGALVFALAHVPGLYLRADQAALLGADNTFVNTVAYALAVLLPPGVFFGVLWWRTRNLLLVVLIHGAIDFLPNLPEQLALWRQAAG